MSKEKEKKQEGKQEEKDVLDKLEEVEDQEKETGHGFNPNPKFKNFLRKHPNKTVLGLAWSLWWRLAIIFFLISFAVNILLAI